jgi:hypothetical protein
MIKKLIQGCQIESKLNRFSLSNRMFWPKSNRMQIELNDFFDFRYDLIRFDLDRNLFKKNPEIWQ